LHAFIVMRDVGKRKHGIIAVEDRMFLGMQDFDFCPNLIITKFTQILPLFLPNLSKLI